MRKNVLLVAVVLSLSPTTLSSQITVEGADNPSLTFVDDASGKSAYFIFYPSDSQVYVGSGLEVGGGPLVASELVAGSVLFYITLRVPEIELFDINGPTRTHFPIYFPSGGVERAESFSWDDAQSRFELSDALQINDNLVVGATSSVAWNSFGNRSPVSGDISSRNDVMVSDDLEVGLNLTVGGDLDLGGDLLLGPGQVGNLLYLGGASDGDQTIYFYEGGSATGRRFRWDDSENRFEMDDALVLSGPIAAGISLTGAAPSYNVLGDDFLSSPTSGAITSSSDLYVDDDVEINDNLYLSKDLYMESSGGGIGANGDQTIRFYEYPNYEYLRWDHADTHFEFSTVLSVPEVVGSLSDLNLGATQHVELMIDSNGNQTAGKWLLYHDGEYTAPKKLAEFQEDGDLLIRGNFNATAFDLAEKFLMSETVRPGDLVRVDPLRSDAIRLASSGDMVGLLGVVSERPGFVLGGPGFGPEDLERSWGPEVRQRFDEERDALEAQLLDEHGELAALLAPAEEADLLSSGAEEPRSAREETVRAKEVSAARQELVGLALERFGLRHLAAVALAGRVRVNVDASGGAIAVGDPLTAGGVPGVAVKATAAGPIIGTALEPFAGGRGKVLVMVHLGWHGGDGAAAAGDPGEAPVGDDPEAPNRNPNRILLITENGHAGTFSVARREEAGTEAELLRLDADGNLFVEGSIRTGSQTVAEYRMVSEPVAAGDVLVADRKHRGLFKPGATAGDTAVVGIAAGHPGVLTGTRVAAIAEVMPDLAVDLEMARASGDREGQERVWLQMTEAYEAVHAPIAMSGIVRARVDASYGAVQVGDLLTTSATLGHAMLAADAAPGTIVGKALEPLDAGTGLIEILVMLR